MIHGPQAHREHTSNNSRVEAMRLEGLTSKNPPELMLRGLRGGVGDAHGNQGTSLPPLTSAARLHPCPTSSWTQRPGPQRPRMHMALRAQRQIALQPHTQPRYSPTPWPLAAHSPACDNRINTGPAPCHPAPGLGLGAQRALRRALLDNKNATQQLCLPGVAR
mmetsp:Transcript_25683/g.40254  ORF Transcript_25683/g.40254 Transcript_25683/m.40254 type:complete len:163 (+) Transcript_25683:466-954(+)